MYLREILDNAILSSEPEEGSDVVLIDSTSAPWCDIPMVVHREPWESIFVKYRAQEPDIEIIGKLLSSHSSDGFMSRFANEDEVRSRYQLLRGEYCSGDVAETKNTEEEAMDPNVNASGSNAGIEEGIDSGFKCDGIAPDLSEEEIPHPTDCEPAVVTLTPDSMDPVAVLSGSAFSGEIQPHAAVEFPGTGEEFEGVPLSKLSGQTTDDTPAASVDDVAEQPAAMDTSEAQQEEAPIGVDEAPVQQEETSTVAEDSSEEQVSLPREVVLSDCLRRFNETHIFDIEGVPDWAQACTRMFAQMSVDFSETFETVPVAVVLNASCLSVPEFIELWQDLSWDSNVSAEIFEIPDTAAFLNILYKSYADCLKYLCYEETEKAKKLADLFGKLIYEG